MSLVSNDGGQSYEEQQFILHADRELAQHIKDMPKEVVEELEKDFHMRLRASYKASHGTANDTHAIIVATVLDHLHDESEEKKAE